MRPLEIQSAESPRNPGRFKQTLAQTQAVLARYGLETMGGNPLEILERHLIANHAATLGAKDHLVEALDEQIVALYLVLDRLVDAIESVDPHPLAALAADGRQVLTDIARSAKAARQRIAEQAYAKYDFAEIELPKGSGNFVLMRQQAVAAIHERRPVEQQESE